MNEAPDYVKAPCATRRFFYSKTRRMRRKTRRNPKWQRTRPPAHLLHRPLTVDALRTAYPDLVNQIENAAAQNATTAERARIKDIEDMTAPGDEQTAYDAKFGDKPQDAAAYAIACMKAQKAAGAKHMADANDDAVKSGVNGVKQAEPAGKTGTVRTAQSPASAAPTT